MRPAWRRDRDVPYIIAEIGVNHDGERERAVALVDLAADAGADAVKVQFFSSDLLAGGASVLTRAQRESGEATASAMLRRLELTIDDLGAVADRARARGIDAIATVFSPELVEVAECIEWASYKTASPDIVHKPLIDTLLRTGRPLIVSTGASDREEIGRAALWVADAADRVAFLHCVSSYPAPAEFASLGAIGDVRRIVEASIDTEDVVVGYSDHTIEVDTGAVARACGASILEKHITYDRGARGPDHAASLDPAQFGAYVSLAHAGRPPTDGDVRIGGPEKRVLACEREVRRLCRQSIVVRRDIGAGEALARDMLTFSRPGGGMPPFMLEAALASRLAVGISAGAPLEEAHLLERVS